MEYFKSIIIVHECDSTMDLGRKLSEFISPPFVVRSDIQTLGRGQYGRIWRSSYGGLYFTEVLPLENVLGFSTFISIPIIRVLRKYVKEVGVKWPNDIVVNRKKLGGILVEKSKFTNTGIGINVKNELHEFDLIATKVSNFSSVEVDTLFFEILEEESILIDEFIKYGFKAFKEEYEGYLVFLKERIKVESSEIYEGLVLGVGDSGELLLYTERGIQRIFSGTVLNYYE